jgi:hypothetical protein
MSFIGRAIRLSTDVSEKRITTIFRVEEAELHTSVETVARRTVQDGYLTGLSFGPQNGRDVPSKRCSTFNGLH